MGKYSKYRQDSLPDLIKLGVGEEFTLRLTGEREHDTDTGPVPVLDLVDDDTLEKRSWMCGTWHGLEGLDLANPSVGDLLNVKRLENKGRSHQYEIRVVDAKQDGAPKSDVPADQADFQSAARTPDVDEDDIPF